MKKPEANEITFFGKITAGFTHEMKNVLAIIRESSGLLEDLLALRQAESFPYREKFMTRLSGIQDQVRRGVELATRLNRFAHSTDELLTTIDLNELSAQLVLLCERFARLKGVALQVHPSDRDLPMRTAPVRLQMALFGALQCCWEKMPAGGALSLSLEKKGDEVLVTIRCDGELGDRDELSAAVCGSEDWGVALDLVESLRGTMAWEESSCSVVMTFPQE